MRITGLNRVDVRRFEFDFDTTWTAFFLDADLNVYSRYGGRDHESSDGRQTKASFLTTMREVLEAHAGRQRKPQQPSPKSPSPAQPPVPPQPERKLAVERDPLGLPVLHPSPEKRETPEDIPLLKAHHQGCVHCHQVQEYRLLQAYEDKTFTRQLLFGYPLPENLGLRFDREHGYRVEKVEAKSLADRAGFRAGDVVLQVNDVPIRSEQDVRWSLHRSRDEAPLTFVIQRMPPQQPQQVPPQRQQPDKTQLQTLTLRPADARWRQTDLSWRKSLRSVPLDLGFSGYHLGREERKTYQAPENRLAIRIVSLRERGLAKNLGVQRNDVIISLGGQTRQRTWDEFLSDLLESYEPGDEVELIILRDGQPKTLRGRFPPWFTTSNSVP